MNSGNSAGTVKISWYIITFPRMAMHYSPQYFVIVLIVI